MDFGEFRRKKHSQSMSESESKHLHVERIYSDYVQTNLTKTVAGSFLNATIKTSNYNCSVTNNLQNEALNVQYLLQI